MIYTELTIKAMKTAYNAHMGQTDISGVPYIFHPYHLAEQMNTEETVCAALLHDVAEDTDITLEQLADNKRYEKLNQSKHQYRHHIFHVDGKKTRVYGSIPKVPWLSDIATGHIATTSVNSEFVFEPTEDVGGLFHIVRNEDSLMALLGKDQVIYFQADSDCFIENIIQYLLVDMLDIREGISNLITDSSVSTEKAFDPNYAKMFTKTGFKYSKSGTVNTWNFGLNMDQLLGNDTLGALEVTLSGKDTGDSGLFSDASVSLDILSFLTVEADIKLVNPSFDVETWPTDIENKYNKVLSWYNNLSESKKADFDSNYKNHPLKGYTMVSKNNYF